MGTITQMYDTGLENLKKAALSVKVRSFLSGNGELDPSDLENPELSLDLQSLIDDPNFEVADGLFPELLQDKLKTSEYSQLTTRTLSHQPNGNGHTNAFSRNPLAYMPQPVHGGSSFGGSTGSTGSSSSSSSGGSPGDSGILVKEEPGDAHHRNGMDFNGNAVTDPNGYNSYNSNVSNVTSPSSSSSSGGSQGYSPNAYIHHHHLTPVTISGSDLGPKGLFNGGPKGLHGHHHNGHHAHNHHHSSSKKLKNVDKSSDEYKRRRERNNIAVRKSREKAKMRSRETEERVKILAKENERLQKKIDLLTEELTFLRSFFSNVGGLPEQIHREFNKHLETFQHHHIQNGIHLQ